MNHIPLSFPIAVRFKEQQFHLEYIILVQIEEFYQNEVRSPKPPMFVKISIGYMYP